VNHPVHARVPKVGHQGVLDYFSSEGPWRINPKKETNYIVPAAGFSGVLKFPEV
jgi:hypothetical protein